MENGGTVRVPPGFYPLSLAGAGPAAGDVDVTRPMTIVGTGEIGSFIGAASLGDRVFDVAADVTLRHLTLLGGSQVRTGGVVRAEEGRLVLSRATIFGGRARAGGAVAVGRGATASIDRSWLFGNRATDRGGALFVRGSMLLARSTLSDNRAEEGGAAYVDRSVPLSVNDATVSANVAARGGAVRAIGDLALFSSTIAGNRAGTAAAVSMSTRSESTVSNSVFARNETSAGAPCEAGFVSNGHNVSDLRGCGLTGPGDVAGVDARIGTLRQNGGPTPTHALKTDSPAVGRGAGCHATDQRGAPRSDCDSGAYEIVLCLGRLVTIVGTPGRTNSPAASVGTSSSVSAGTTSSRDPSTAIGPAEGTATTI